MKKILLKLFTFSVLLGALIPTLPAHAGTGVYVNGQEINYSQWVAVSRMVGSPVAPGQYWYNPQTGAYGVIGGANGGGDRFWNSRYSAGNSNADNSQGYVSLPGGGFATYGM